MSLPNYVRIMGCDYSVEVSDELQTFDHAGICKLHSDEIVIGSGVANKMPILIHELTEAINYRLELNLKHSKLSQIASAFYQMLVDNPDLLCAILAQAEDAEVDDD